MNRRRFCSAVLTAALGKAAPGSRIRIGFLGASHSHAEGKIEAVRDSPDYDISGIWESDPKLTSKFAKDGFRVVSRSDILNDPSIQVVAVEGDVASHAEHCLAALQAGKHAHVEKPPADSLSEFIHLQNEARERKLLLQVGYMWRYNPATMRAMEAARQGWLGEIYLVRASMNTLLADDRREEWGKFRGGQMFEQGSHLMDLMVRLMGRPSKITPYLRRQRNDTLADNTLAVLEWPKALGIIQAATLQPHSSPYRCFEILGTGGTALVEPLEPPALSLDLANPAGPYKSGRHQIPMPAYRRYVDDFSELARSIRESKPLSTTPAQELMIQEALLRACEM